MLWGGGPMISPGYSARPFFTRELPGPVSRHFKKSQNDETSALISNFDGITYKGIQMGPNMFDENGDFVGGPSPTYDGIPVENVNFDKEAWEYIHL